MATSGFTMSSCATSRMAQPHLRPSLLRRSSRRSPGAGDGAQEIRRLGHGSAFARDEGAHALPQRHDTEAVSVTHADIMTERHHRRLTGYRLTGSTSRTASSPRRQPTVDPQCAGVTAWGRAAHRQIASSRDCADVQSRFGAADAWRAARMARQTVAGYPLNRSTTPWSLAASSWLTVRTLPPSSTQAEAMSACNGSS